MASPNQLRNLAELADLFTISRTIATSLVRQTVAAAMQPTLTPGMMTMQERRTFLAKQAAPDSLFISATQLTELRFEAACAASGFDTETIVTAPHGSVITDQVNGPMDWPTLGVSIGIPKDPLLGSYVAKPADLESILTMDYAAVAKTRLVSPLGRYGLLYEEVIPVAEGEF